jgi:hypothetical protein
MAENPTFDLYDKAMSGVDAINNLPQFAPEQLKHRR